MVWSAEVWTDQEGLVMQLLGGFQQLWGEAGAVVLQHMADPA
jgi:hypothetical protein